MATFGKVHDLTKEFNFEWKIDNFFSLSEESGKPYNSPLFSFAGESWFLSVYPNGDPEDNSVGCIGVYLNRDLSGSPIINLTWTFGLKTVDGKKVHEKQCAYAFGEDDMGWGSPVLLKRSTLFGRKSELVPSDILTIVFSVDYCSKSSDDSGKFCC